MRFDTFLPLSRSQEDKLLDEVEQVAKSAVMGSFLTAIAQGFAGGIGMWIAGFPGLFWGTMMGFASFIPCCGNRANLDTSRDLLVLNRRYHMGYFLNGLERRDRRLY